MEDQLNGLSAAEVEQIVAGVIAEEMNGVSGPVGDVGAFGRKVAVKTATRVLARSATKRKPMETIAQAMYYNDNTDAVGKVVLSNVFNEKVTDAEKKRIANNESQLYKSIIYASVHAGGKNNMFLINESSDKLIGTCNVQNGKIGTGKKAFITKIRIAHCYAASGDLNTLLNLNWIAGASVMPLLTNAEFSFKINQKYTLEDLPIANFQVVNNRLEYTLSRPIYLAGDDVIQIQVKAASSFENDGGATKVSNLRLEMETVELTTN